MTTDQSQLATTTESNATAIYQRMQDPMLAIKEMGQMFAASGMFGCTKVEQGQVLALACLIEGKSPFELMRTFHIIGGNLSMRSSACLAQFQQKGGRCTWLSALNDEKEACATFSIGGQELERATYTIEDAKREGLLGGANPNWKTRPPDMLRARLITKAIRMLAPGIVVGLIDETDIPPALPTTPLLSSKEPVEGPVVGAAGEAKVGGLEAGMELENFIAHADLNVQDVEAFCVERKLLNEGQTLKDLSVTNRKKIVKNFSDFVLRMQEFKKGGKE
jgi:hypothetical protein